MAQGRRDDFSAATRKTLAERVGYCCSNPDCRRKTVGPNSDPMKSSSIGEAAHIRAAAPKGPRYDPSMTSEERASVENGIWLCRNCARLIDVDSNKYTIEVLEQWKQQAEQNAKEEISTREGKKATELEGSKNPSAAEKLCTNDSFTNSASKPTLFLSYCSKDECIANIIENTLNAETNNGIIVSRYTRVPYRQSFKDFMKSIPEHDYVLCVVSDSYLKSQACMYEVGEIVKSQTYKQKLLFVVLNEADRKYYPKDYDGAVGATDIYDGSINKLEYTKYWKEKYFELEGKIDSLDDKEATAPAITELKEIGQIYRNDINVFLDFLAEYNGKSFEELYSNHFIDIIRLIVADDICIPQKKTGLKDAGEDTSDTWNKPKKYFILTMALFLSAVTIILCLHYSVPFLQKKGETNEENEKSYSVTLNANGGSVFPEIFTVKANHTYGMLPTPARDGYSFIGWYTDTTGETQVNSSTVYTATQDTTLYARWEIHPQGNWVKASEVPDGVHIVSRMWTYTRTTMTESRSDSLIGYTQTGSYWVENGRDSFCYATFPSGFDTGDWYYTNWNREPYDEYITATAKREVSNSWAGWIYWHWMYDANYASGESTRAIWNQSGWSSTNGFLYKYFGAFNSTTDYQNGGTGYTNNLGWTNYIVNDRTSWDDCQGSTRWFRFDYYMCEYVDYYKMFQYQRVEDLESTTPVNAETNENVTISNVQEWVQYSEEIEDDKNNPRDFVFLVDCSDSMEQTDTNMRSTDIMDLFLKMVPGVDKSRIGIICFGNRGEKDYVLKSLTTERMVDFTLVQLVSPLVSVRDLYEDEKNTIGEAIRNAAKNSENSSPIGAALLSAVDLLESNGARNNYACIIVLSDGIITSESNYKEYIKKYIYEEKMAEEAAEWAGDHKWPVYALQLSNNFAPQNSENSIMQQIAVKSGAGADGYYNIIDYSSSEADVAHAILTILSRSIGNISNISQETITEDERFYKVFTIDNLTSEATIVACGNNVKEIQLISPSGKELYPSRDFILSENSGKYICAKLANPEPGEWTAIVKGKGKITLYFVTAPNRSMQDKDM